jgi:membrane fusion protein (multidrug efflux system)
VRIRAILPNKDGRLKPGMLMTVEVRSNPRMTLGVPEMAVIERAEGSFVYRAIDKDGKKTVALAKIATGQRFGGMVEVKDGVKEGELIVTEGVQRARPGQPIRIGDGKPPGPDAKPAAAKPPAAARS